MPRCLEPGDTYGPYRVRDVLGQGAFAWVYQVEGPGLRRPAALKLSLEPVVDAETAQRSLREISIQRTLTNSHVVRVHDAGQDDQGHVFILMDELRGAQLDVWHDFDRPMEPVAALRVVHQACLGLAEVHARGIVHRDLKPENLWVEPHHNIKVIDFGLARGWDSTSTVGMGLTRQGMLVGTPRYIQPEQVIGGVLTPRSDVYSLATILYELLTGHCVYFPDEPFSRVRERYREDPASWIGAHLQRQVVPLQRYPVTASLPPALHQLVYRGLAKDPSERFIDARALGNAVGEVLHYDLGAMPAAILRVTLPWGGYEDRLLLPGIHRIGRDADCEIVLDEAELEPEQAVLDWAGPPALPELHALHDDGRVRIDGHVLRGRRRLRIAQGITVGEHSLSISYPQR